MNLQRKKAFLWEQKFEREKRLSLSCQCNIQLLVHSMIIGLLTPQNERGTNPILIRTARRRRLTAWSYARFFRKGLLRFDAFLLRCVDFMSHFFAILATCTVCDVDVRTGRFLLAASTQFRSNCVPGTMYLLARWGHLVDLNKVFVMLTTCHIMATYSRSF